MSNFRLLEDYPEDDYYLGRMKEILEGYPKLGPLQHPSKLLEHVYIGNQDNADDLDLMQALEISHVLNVAGTRTFDLTRSPYRKDTGITGFLMMPAEDYEEFDIMQYFMDAIIFLDKVKTAGGRALVHCNIGVNRSGAIVAAYLMVHQKRPLLKVIEDLKSKRSLILQNVGFRRQLIRFARCRGLLDLPERPPKKPSFYVNGYTSSISRSKDYATSVTNQERSETVKNVSNGPTNQVEEVSGEPVEEKAKEANDGNQSSGEQTSGSSDEQKTPAPNASGVGKYAGYENDLGNSEDKDDKKSEKLNKNPNTDAESAGNVKESEKAHSKISYLDSGSSQPKIKDEQSSFTRPMSSHNMTSRSKSSHRRADGNRVVSEDFLSSKLSALSLELPRSRVPTRTSQTYGVTRYLPNTNPANEFLSQDAYSSFRVPGLDKIVTPVSSLSQHVSRESSVSDTTNSIHTSSLDGDDFTSKYNTSDSFKSLIAPPPSSYFDSDRFTRDYTVPILPRVSTKPISSSATEKNYISPVKPRSYYQRLVSPRRAVEDFENEVLGFTETIRNGFGQLTSKPTPFIEGNGMLFTPHWANPKATSTSHRSSLSSSEIYDPLSSFENGFTTGNSYVKNTPYNRNSLSDLDSLRSYGNAPYRPTANYRNALDYDDALDEYSDLLEASLGRSNAASSAVKSKVRVGPGRRRIYQY